MAKTNILIIEDSDDIRESTAEILQLAGYQVYQASSGKQGVEMAIQYKPDVILCDIMMSDLDGYGVLHFLSTRDDTSLIPFVFMTAKTDKADIRKGMDLGADDYLTKPFDDLDLLHAVEARLIKSTRQKRIYSETLDPLFLLFKEKNGLDVLQRSFKDRKVRYLKTKQIVYYEGDPANAIFLVLTGSVKTLKRAEDGRELLLAVHGPKDYFGITSMLAGEEYKETAEVIDDCSLCSLPKDTVDQLLYRYPEVAERFIKILAGNLLQNQEQLLQLAYHSVRKRMAGLLIRLHSSGSSSTLEHSRDNLAAMAGIATETVSRVLTDFKDAGFIEKTNGKIRVLNPTGLERLKN